MSGLFEASHYAFNVYALPPLIVGSIIFLLGLGTMMWEHGERVSLSFFLMTLATALWLTAYGIAFMAKDHNAALFWVQLSHFGVSLIPSFVFLFTIILVRQVQSFRVYAGLNFFLSLFFYFGGLRTRSWIVDIAPNFWGYYARYGHTAISFLVFFFSALFASLILLWKGYHEAASEERLRKRLKAFLWAFLAGYLASVDFIPAFGIPVYPFGYLAVMAFIVMTAYAIRRYHLVDITPAFAAQQVLETMQSAVLVTDLQGVVCVANKTACRMFGYEERDLLGKPVSRITETPFDIKVSPGGREAAITSPTFAWSTGEIRNHGSTWRARDGRKIHVSMSASPLRGSQGAIEGMVYVALDISELKNATEALQKAHDLLERHVAERTLELVQANLNLNSEVVERKRAQEALKRTHDELEIQVLKRTAELSKVNLTLKAEIAERQRTEEVLKESEERFRSIAESANDAIVSADSDGKIISWNKGAFRIFGYEEKEICGQPLTVLMPERYREAHRKGIARMTSGGESLVLGRTVELAGVRKNGEEFPLELSLSSWKTAKGFFYSGILRDISERKRISEERDRFFNLSLDMLSITDLKGYFKQLNPAWEKTLGWSLEELMAKPYLEFIHPDDRQAALEEARKTAGGEVISTFENRYLCKDGSYRWLLWNAIPLPEKGLVYNAARDITERRRAKEMRFRLASIVESTDDAILSMNLSGIIMTWNRGAEKIYGYQAEEMIGKSFGLLVPKDYLEEVQGILNRIWEGGRLENYETRRIRKDGRLLDVSLTISPIKDETGKIAGISYIGRDITRLKLAEDALRQKKNLEIKSEFISMVSHELRTPLTAIKMGIDILMVEEAGSVTAEQKEWLGMAQRNVERLTHLINNVLDFQKLDAGEMPYEFQEEDLNELIRELEKTVRSLAHNKELVFEFALAGDLPKVSFDREKISEVLMNLAGNAVKFTDRGTICLKTEKAGGMVEVSVSDTGIGIRDKDMPKLFTHFTQLHGDHTRTGGTGLGLAISKKIIEQHHGIIGAKSEYGKGSTFYFRLPLGVPAPKKDKL